MPHRALSLALTTGLCVGLLAGCTRHMAPSEGPPPVALRNQDNVELPKVPPSPYPLVPTPTFTPRVEAKDTPTATNPQSNPATAPIPDADFQKVNHYPPLPSNNDFLPRNGPHVEATPEPAAKPAVEPPLLGALRCLMEKRPADAVTLLKGFDTPNQELLLAMLPLVARLGEESLERAGPREVAVAVDQLETAIEPLRLRAALTLDKVCFCGKIDKYGVYEPLPEGYAFRPGELVQIYVELHNFASQQREGSYEVRLGSSLRLMRQADAKEELAYQQGFNDRQCPDRSQTQRHDFFKICRFCIPENMVPGTYKLYLRVEDVPTHRWAERALDMRLTTRPGGTNGD